MIINNDTQLINSVRNCGLVENMPHHHLLFSARKYAKIKLLKRKYEHSN